MAHPSPPNNSAGGRRSDKSPVDTARQLVTSLSQLEKETADSVWNPKSPKSKSRWDERDVSPSPLERYLKHYEAEPTPSSYYEPPAPTSAAKRRARKHQAHLDQLLEARQVLNKLEATRETLEGNLASVLRSRRDVHVFAAMMAAAPEGTSEQLRIQKMVNKKISALEGDVQREVLRGLAQEQAQQLAAKKEQERQRLAAKRGGGGGGTMSNLACQTTEYLAKNKFSIAARQSEQSARLAYGKQNFNANANVGSRGLASTKGKENRASSKVKPPPRPTVIRDQKTLTRTYGKPEYERGRTTIRDPYMHFQNTKRGVASKTAVSPEGRSRSPPKSGRGVDTMGSQSSARQFYFSPTRGYIPLHATDSAPVQGQLVTMAIPLGAPRMERGVRSAAVPSPMSPSRRASNPVTSTPVPVTSVGNVAVVSFPVAEEAEETREREPELSKQVLPPIDIDSISPSSSRRSDIQIRSPQHGNVNLTFLQNSRDETEQVGDEDNSDLDDTFTEGDPDLEQSGQGLQFPGYEPRPQAEYSGPSFPPQRVGHAGGSGDWMAGSTQAPPPRPQLSDVMAEDLRRRDLLEQNAVYWLEQELMAQVLSKVMPVEVGQKPADADASREAAASEADGSEISAREDSLLVADMIGQGGLQLFIDAGQPVDNGLIQALVKEVLQEKVTAMLAQGSTEGQGANARDDVETVAEERRVPSGPPRVPTPEPTPKASPIASPRRQQPASAINRPVTPPLSPPMEGFRFKPPPVAEEAPEQAAQPPPLPPPREGVRRSEPEVDTQQHQQQQVQQQQLYIDTADVESEPSVSIDISEEMRRVAGQGRVEEPEEPAVVVSRHSVATPPPSPPPVAEEDRAVQRRVTPPPTPSASLDLAPTKSAQQRSLVQREAKRDADPQEVMEQEEEEEEEEEEEHPEPIMISVAVGEDHPLTSGVQTTPRRTPSPKRPRTPVSVATEPSPPPSTESSVSETVNENVSEGQWLLSRSEGQVVAGLHINEAMRQRILKKSAMNRGGVDVSSASTLRDTDELDLDDGDQANKSEGEFLYAAGLPAPDQDPMLQLLAEMQRHPGVILPQRDIPAPQVRQILSGPAPRDVMSSTGRSLGELSMGQVPPTRLVQVRSREDRAEVGGQLQRQYDHDHNTRRGKPGQRRGSSRSPAGSPNRSVEEDVYDGRRERQRRERREEGADRRRGRSSRTPSPLQSQERAGERERQRGGRGSPQRSGTPPQQDLQQQQLLSSGSTRGRSSRGQMQYQPVLSQGAPLPTRGRASGAYKGGARRSSDSKLSRSSDRAMQRSGSSYMSESVSRSADSASLCRSGENNTGVLTSSFRSRQSSTGAKKSVDFDLTGTHEHRQWHEDREMMGLSGSVGGTGRSRDRYSPTRLSAGSDPNRSRSLGLTYSFDGSLDDSELKRLVESTGGTGTAPYRMSVTIPSTAGGDESDLSEIEISDKHYH